MSEFKGRSHTAGVGDAAAGDIERRTVVYRGAHVRQTKRDIDAFGKAHML